MRSVIVIGGGAAGFFTAINIKRKCPDLQVTILEKTGKILQKVKVSGGGRCNVTNGREQPGELVPFYPRGGKKLYPVFKTFGTMQMRQWLAECGVKTKVEDDLRVFPESNDSQSIIDCFTKECVSLGIAIDYQVEVLQIISGKQWQLETSKGIRNCDYLIVSAGASGKCWKMLSEFGLKMNEQVPSLFTFHIKDERIESLQGLSFQDVQLKVAGTKLLESGPLLITHWGLSGPAILKLSAWGAIELSHKSYRFDLIINFLGISYDECKVLLEGKKSTVPKKQIKNEPLEGIPKRYWERIVSYCQIGDRVFEDLGKTHINKLCEELTQARFQVNGKSAFKEEFVTAGGVDLSEINTATMEAKNFSNLFLAGEVIDVDALTGGFNFQACWSAGWLISEHIFKTQIAYKGA